jgi:hypothetical protein
MIGKTPKRSNIAMPDGDDELKKKGKLCVHAEILEI